MAAVSEKHLKDDRSNFYPFHLLFRCFGSKLRWYIHSIRVEFNSYRLNLYMWPWQSQQEPYPLTFILSRIPCFLFFCLQAARVRVPGRSPFSQLIPHETEKSKVVRKTKTFSFKGQNNERINQTNSKTNYPPRSSESKTRRPFRSQVIDGALEEEEDRPRAVIGSRYLWEERAFDRRVRSADDKGIKSQDSHLSVSGHPGPWFSWRPSPIRLSWPTLLSVLYCLTLHV